MATAGYRVYRAQVGGAWQFRAGLRGPDGGGRGRVARRCGGLHGLWPRIAARPGGERDASAAVRLPAAGGAVGEVIVNHRPVRRKCVRPRFFSRCWHRLRTDDR